MAVMHAARIAAFLFSPEIPMVFASFIAVFKKKADCNTTIKIMMNTDNQISHPLIIS